MSLPLVYIMRSSFTSLLFLIGSSYYAIDAGYLTRPTFEPYLYWVMLLAIVPHYYLLIKKSTSGNFVTFHNWIIPISLLLCLGTISQDFGKVTWLAYVFYVWPSLYNWTIGYFSRRQTSQ